MNLPVEPPIPSTSSNSEISRNSISSSSARRTNYWTQKIDERLWRAIDFLHIVIMFFSLYTAIIVAILRNELFEQCPLYAKLYLRVNATLFLTDTIDRETAWGNVHTCEFASFTYLSAFVLAFISLWVHIVFRRVVRTERLLRLPVGLLTLIFALLSIVATSIVTDGVIKFCLNSPPYICSTSGSPLFRASRWKIISLPVGGWLTTLSILLNALVRGIQLFSKPKKTPQALKSLLQQFMANRLQHKIEKDGNEPESQISRPPRETNRSQSAGRYPADHRGFSSELYPYYYPPIPQYRQIEKRSRFQRICCPCLRRRRRRNRSFHEPYRPFVVPEEYYHRLNHLQQNGAVPINLCHRHSIHHPAEQQTQTDLNPQRKPIDQTNEIPFLGRRRSSVRFEDEPPLVKPPEETTPAPKTEPIPIVKNEEKEKTVTPAVENELQRNVSFRNNEDDLWTTITINTERSAPVQSSHFNRLTLENLSYIDTSISNNDNGVTAIHIGSRPIESIEKEISPPLPPPLPPQSPCKATRHRPTTHRHKPPPPPPSRCHTTTSEDDVDLRHIKPVEEINTIVADKYNYNDLSQALKSNVHRLKNTFINAQENQSISQQRKTHRPTLPQNSNLNIHSSDD